MLQGNCTQILYCVIFGIKLERSLHILNKHSRPGSFGVEICNIMTIYINYLLLYFVKIAN